MKARNPKLEIVCELISKPSIGYLTTEDGDEYESPIFSSGHVFAPALLDILLCQSFFAPHVRSHSILLRTLHRGSSLLLLSSPGRLHKR
jgi:hypothetical protein